MIYLIIADSIFYTVFIWATFVGIYSDNYFQNHGYYPPNVYRTNYFKWASLSLFIALLLFIKILNSL